MNKVFKIFIAGIALLLIAACGSKKSPTGGVVDLEKPVVVASVPEQYGDISKGKIEISFSKPLDKSTLTQGIYIYPPITNKKVTYESNTIQIRILEKLIPDTNYYVTLSTRLKDIRGNTLDKNQTFVFRNGELQDTRLSGKILYEDKQDAGLPVQLNILSADSLLIMSNTTSGNAYILDALNPAEYILRAYVDKDQNGRYDFSKEPYFEGEFSLKRFANLDIKLNYQDSTIAVIRSVRPISSRELEVHLSKEIASYQSLTLTRTNDLVAQSVNIINQDKDKLSLITAELDTSRYSLELTELKDSKGNTNSISRLEFAGISKEDQSPPQVLTTVPRNGTSVNDLQPILEIHFSEIIPKENFRYRLSGAGSNEEIPLSILRADHRVYRIKPSQPLQNYRSYTLAILEDTADSAGNKLGKTYELIFLPLYRSSK
ncbi:MAG: Ig-like domain-containing protein [Candidatus Cloacimonetes bacterium]|nr:Ig-like domain-containing protein [Candidatus Cloacimonadota bacterium]